MHDPTTPPPRRLVPLDDIVGRSEIGERLEVTPSTVDSWRRRYRGTFPAPELELSGTPLWRWSAVAAWYRAEHRRTGRPRKLPTAPDVATIATIVLVVGAALAIALGGESL